MALKPFRFLVTVEVERMEGKFASRDEIAELLLDSLDCDPGSISTDQGEYETVSWDVSETD